MNTVLTRSSDGEDGEEVTAQAGTPNIGDRDWLLGLSEISESIEREFTSYRHTRWTNGTATDEEREAWAREDADLRDDGESMSPIGDAAPVSPMGDAPTAGAMYRPEGYRPLRELLDSGDFLAYCEEHDLVDQVANFVIYDLSQAGSVEELVRQHADEPERESVAVRYAALVRELHPDAPEDDIPAMATKLIGERAFEDFMWPMFADLIAEPDLFPIVTAALPEDRRTYYERMASPQQFRLTAEDAPDVDYQCAATGEQQVGRAVVIAPVWELTSLDEPTRFSPASVAAVLVAPAEGLGDDVDERIRDLCDRIEIVAPMVWKLMEETAELNDRWFRERVIPRPTEGFDATSSHTGHLLMFKLWDALAMNTALMTGVNRGLDAAELPDWFGAYSAQVAGRGAAALARQVERVADQARALLDASGEAHVVWERKRRKHPNEVVADAEYDEIGMAALEAAWNDLDFVAAVGRGDTAVLGEEIDDTPPWFCLLRALREERLGKPEPESSGDDLVAVPFGLDPDQRDTFRSGIAEMDAARTGLLAVAPTLGSMAARFATGAALFDKATTGLANPMLDEIIDRVNDRYFDVPLGLYQALGIAIGENDGTASIAEVFSERVAQELFVAEAFAKATTVENLDTLRSQAKGGADPE